MDRLAQELIDIIIYNLHDSPSDLHECSLVCRSWLPACQRHLFRCIILGPKPYFHLRSDLSSSERLYQALLGSPHLANYIKGLKVYEGLAVREQDWIAEDQTLPLVLRMLGKLEMIELRCLPWSDLTLYSKQSLCRVFQLPSMRFVEIERDSFDKMEDFLSLLDHARGLTGLSFYDTKQKHYLLAQGGEDDQDEQRLYLHMPRYLSDLRLALYDNTTFINWLLGHRSHSKNVSHIHTLHMLIIHQTCGNAINQLLRAIGSSLKHFRLHMRIKNPPAVDIDMSFNSNIKSLYLNSIAIAKGPVDPLSWLLHFLSTINVSNRVEEIKLEVDIPGWDEEPVDWSAWKSVDAVLAGPQFKFLQKLDIKLWAGSRWSDWVARECDNLVSMFPLLAERGVLVYTH